MVWFLRLLVSVFFRHVAVVGDENIPESGPVIFAGNHPNSLIDPVIIIATCGRKVHFAAASVLFRTPVMKALLSAVGAVPVYRKMDGAKGSNDDTFRTLHEVLAGGAAMGIFPEGLSHDEAQLQQLKTGTARIAVGLLRKHPDLTVRVVPCGLNYVQRRAFRSRAMVQYGVPMELTAAALSDDAEEQRAAVLAITSELDTRIRELTVNAEDWDTLRVLEAVRRLYQPDDIPLEDRVELARRFTSVYAKVRDSDDVRDIYRRVHEYQERLDEAGLTDRDLVRNMGVLEVAARAFANLVRVAFWAPVAIPGLTLHVPLGLSAGWAGRKLAVRKDAVATSKLMIGALLVLSAWAGLVFLAYLSGGLRTAGFLALALPLSGYGALRVLERGASLKRLVLHGWRAVTLRREMKILRLERKGLVDLIDDVVAAHLPQDMERLYPSRKLRFSAEDLGH